jgi:nucleotide-binding universal stress UspA family protein
MLPIKKIVCPTDFSDPSYEGLKAAAELADHFSAKLILMHIISPVPVVPGASAPTGFHLASVLDELQSSAEKSLADLVQEKIHQAISVQTIVLLGKPAEEIANLAEREKADMIVMSTHGESGWQRFLSGSVAEKVVRMAACPVLTVCAADQK